MAIVLYQERVLRKEILEKHENRSIVKSGKVWPKKNFKKEEKKIKIGGTRSRVLTFSISYLKGNVFFIFPY